MVKNDRYQRNYTYGNVAYEVQPHVNHETKLKKQVKKNTHSELKIKLKMMCMLGIFTMFSFLLLCRFAQINTLTSNIRVMKSDLKVVQKENENLEVQIARVNNIKDIEKQALDKYGMVVPDNKAIVYIDVKPLSVSEEKQDQKATAFESIQKLLGLIY